MKKEIFDFFTTDNKSGYKTTANWLSKNKSELYKEIIELPLNKSNTPSFKEMVYNYIHELIEIPFCKHCGIKKVNFRDKLTEGYNQFCSIDCTNKSSQKKENTKNGLLKKYGVESHNQLDLVKEKKKATLMKNYGVETGMHSPIIRKKIEETNIERYGFKNPAKSDLVKEKLKKNVINGNEINVLRLTERINIYGDKIKEILGSGYYKLMCKICNNDYEINSNLLNSRLTNNNILCLHCNKLKSYSSLQEEIFEYVKSVFSGEIILSYRHKEIKEIDIFIPELKIGIEVNGIYWHSDKFLTDKNYHLNKTELSIKNEITLLHIFEDEWNLKKEIIKSIILGKIGLFTNRIFSRKCEIVELSYNEINDFLKNNHIQAGNVKMDVKLGLKYNNEIVSILALSSYRQALGFKNKIVDEYELVRFANKKFHIINGSLSKLFKFFEKKYNPNKVISYSDRRFFNGKSYINIGFKHISNTEPNYWYFKNNKREHRLKYQKHLLVKDGFDINETENEIMKKRGFHRIYDSGNVKLEWNKKGL